LRSWNQTQGLTLFISLKSLKKILGEFKYKWCRIESFKNSFAHQRFISSIPNFCGTRRFCGNHTQNRHHFSSFSLRYWSSPFSTRACLSQLSIKTYASHYFSLSPEAFQPPTRHLKPCLLRQCSPVLRVNGTRVTRAWWRPSSLIIQCCRTYSQFWSCARIQICMLCIFCCCCAWSCSVAVLSTVRVLKSDQSAVA